MKTLYIFLIIIFIVFYSLFVFSVDLSSNFASEIIIGSVFFFALFSGFFITRQNERYTRIVETLADRDGAFSYLYRISGLIPRIQKEVREIIREHYNKILFSDNWAFHEFNPSATLTKLTKTFGDISNEELQGKTSSAYITIWQTIFQLQQDRKRIIVIFSERLVIFQWLIIYVLALILIVSFDFLPSESLVIDLMKIIFSTAVFIVIILLKQLNDLSLFGKEFSRHIAKDVLNILDEVDLKKLNQGAKS